MGSKIIASIGAFFLDWLWKKLASAVLSAIGFFMRKEKAKKESNASVDPLKKAKTEQEIDDAIDDALDGF